MASAISTTSFVESSIVCTTTALALLRYFVFPTKRTVSRCAAGAAARSITTQPAAAMGTDPEPMQRMGFRIFTMFPFPKSSVQFLHIDIRARCSSHTRSWRARLCTIGRQLSHGEVSSRCPARRRHLDSQAMNSQTRVLGDIRALMPGRDLSRRHRRGRWRSAVVVGCHERGVRTGGRARTANGAPTAAISATPAMRRSTRSTATTSTTWKSRGGSRPTISAPGPNTTFNRPP